MKLRLCENNSFAAFTPYASRFNYEVAISPKRHVRSIIDLNDNELDELSQVLKRVLTKLKRMKVAYNLIIHNAPMNRRLHFHIKLHPRMKPYGGFELETDTVINVVSPERAARYFRK